MYQKVLDNVKKSLYNPTPIVKLECHETYCHQLAKQLLLEMNYLYVNGKKLKFKDTLTEPSYYEVDKDYPYINRGDFYFESKGEKYIIEIVFSNTKAIPTKIERCQANGINLIVIDMSYLYDDKYMQELQKRGKVKSYLEKFYDGFLDKVAIQKNSEYVTLYQ